MAGGALSHTREPGREEGQDEVDGADEVEVDDGSPYLCLAARVVKVISASGSN